jgi:hypothetical protein
MKNVVLLVALLTMVFGGLLGCRSNVFDYPNRQSDGRLIEEGRTFFVFGLIDGNDGPLIAYQMCNGPVKSVETVHTLGNMCIGCVTLQIYTPNTVRITCASGVGHRFYLDENDVAVGHEAFDLETGEILESNFQADFI